MCVFCNCRHSQAEALWLTPCSLPQQAHPLRWVWVRDKGVVGDGWVWL